MDKLTCQRHLGWCRYELEVEPAEGDHHYRAKIAADPTERIHNHDRFDFRLGDIEEWSLDVDEPDEHFLTVIDQQPDQRTFTVEIGKAANGTQGTVSGSFVREGGEDDTIRDDRIPFYIPLRSGQLITIIYHLLEEDPAEEPDSGLIEQIHRLYDESRPYKNLSEFQEDAGKIVSVQSELRIINKLSIESEQYKQNYGTRAAEFIANRLLGRPDFERCIDSQEEYETVVETHNSSKFPGLPRVDTDTIQQEYLPRYFGADSEPQTQPEMFGFDQEFPLIQSHYGASQLALALLGEDVETVRRQLENLIPRPLYSHLDERGYEEKKNTGENPANRAEERARAWTQIVPFATIERRDEFEYVLANYLYWVGNSTEIGRAYETRLFAAAARLFSAEYVDIPLFHRKAKMRFHSQRATQLRFDEYLTEEEREERFRRAASHYQKAYQLANESTADFDSNPNRAARYRCLAASMQIRHLKDVGEFAQAFEEVENANDALDTILGEGGSEGETYRKRLRAEKTVLSAEKEKDEGNFRPAIDDYWQAFKLFTEASKGHSAAHIENRINAIFRELERNERGTAASDTVRKAVRRAYNNSCAVCGVKRLSPEGEPEVEVAHIKPKEDKGIYLQENLLPLCRFHHWAFDVGWFYIDYDYRIHVAQLPERPGYDDLQDIAGEQLRTPSDGDFRPPHELFLSYRRQITDFADDNLSFDITSPSGQSDGDSSSDGQGEDHRQERQVVEEGFFSKYDIGGSKNDLISGPESTL